MWEFDWPYKRAARRLAEHGGSLFDAIKAGLDECYEIDPASFSYKRPRASPPSNLSPKIAPLANAIADMVIQDSATDHSEMSDYRGDGADDAGSEEDIQAAAASAFPQQAAASGSMSLPSTEANTRDEHVHRPIIHPRTFWVSRTSTDPSQFAGSDFQGIVRAFFDNGDEPTVMRYTLVTREDVPHNLERDFESFTKLVWAKMGLLDLVDRYNHAAMTEKGSKILTGVEEWDDGMGCDMLVAGKRILVYIVAKPRGAPQISPQMSWEELFQMEE